MESNFSACTEMGLFLVVVVITSSASSHRSFHCNQKHKHEVTKQVL